MPFAGPNEDLSRVIYLFTVVPFVSPEDESSLDTADDDVVEDAGGIETSVARHAASYRSETGVSRIIYFFTVVPLSSLTSQGSL